MVAATPTTVRSHRPCANFGNLFVDRVENTCRVRIDHLQDIAGLDCLMGSNTRHMCGWKSISGMAWRSMAVEVASVIEAASSGMDVMTAGSSPDPEAFDARGHPDPSAGEVEGEWADVEALTA